MFSRNLLLESFGFLLIAALMTFTTDAFADVYTVGSDTDCQYLTIAQAVTAAASHTGADEIHVQTGTWAQSEIDIDNQDLTIIGGFGKCSDSTPREISSSSLKNADTTSVLSITGASHIVLQGLVITNSGGDGISFNDSSGDLDSLALGNVSIENNAGTAITFTATGNVSLESSGVSHNLAGGISFKGSGNLTLDDSSCGFNQARDSGGCIYVNSSSNVVVTLRNTSISHNSAGVDGGGIYLAGFATLYTDPSSTISTNMAAGNGGGIALFGAAKAYVSSPMVTNRATNGGGISAVASSGSGGLISLYSVAGGDPVKVVNNTASNEGGGIYIVSPEVGQNAETFCAQDFNIFQNYAAEGAAIYASLASNQQAPTLFINSQNCAPAFPPFVVASCSPDAVSCDEIDNNVNGTAENPSGSGASIVLDNDSMVASRFIAENNNADTLIRITTAASAAYPSYAQFSNCLVAENSDTHYLVDLSKSGGPHLDVDGCTFANNKAASTINTGTTVHQTLGTFALSNSIVFNPGATVVSGLMNGSTANYLVSDEIASLGAGSNIQNVDKGIPTFVDEANHDYHLTPTSIGVDYAPADSELTIDLDGHQRPQTQPTVNTSTPMDVGAYEIPRSCIVADSIFCDGFEIP